MRRAWFATTYLVTGGATAVASAVAIVALAGALALSFVLVGVALLAPAVRVLEALVDLERRRAERLLVTPITAEPRTSDMTPAARLRAAAGDPATYRSAAWLTVHAIAGVPLAAGVLLLWLIALGGLIVPLMWWAVPVEAPLTFVVPITSWVEALLLPPLLALAALTLLRWAVPAFGVRYALAARAAFAPSSRSRLERRVTELTATRAGALDVHAAELRRIERDLHDGTQARLVAIAIHLGVAQNQRAADPALADQLIDRARTSVEAALTELRAVVRGIYPPILADRGLPGAVHALAADCPVPLTVRVTPLQRLPAALESAAYFVVAEALANIARHSGATGGDLRVEHRAGQLVVNVTDDGVGGAQTSNGTGLTGIRRRVAALDGRVELSSPIGGPTVLRVELPCAS
ncbi:sensor histidine kinase [Micromonospora parathelypteridis]|uniref:histidine kinase n=1 Tax=Micromonospora parathelypteridis TaxID=1839617 RepID=A0A840W4M9_9ACTN|nr:sensor histidine kinase [Micromonospora parathelypteridis]MBB5478091.1 signal transduction histidine kinase [Micromonospora parathelypteridis]GGO13344.1 histidine kinase [Micromonospora parathelypteridis]